MKLRVKDMTFPEQVRCVRMILQLTQTQLAEQMGISYATVSRWERENRTPQMATLGKFYSFCMRNSIEIDITEKEE
ncbi:MAG: helix-turn-helix transcriptional regulator [Clostridia bacterium]|nr:helix-turn-helix transcriptional regulator [Clostridia bacterium]